MTKRIILTPSIFGNKGNHYAVSSSDRTITFDCEKLDYEDQYIERIILNAENLAPEFAEKYLSTKSLLTFEVEEAKNEENNILFLKTFRFIGFYNSSLSFKVLEVVEKKKSLRIEVVDN